MRTFFNYSGWSCISQEHINCQKVCPRMFDMGSKRYFNTWFKLLICSVLAVLLHFQLPKSESKQLTKIMKTNNISFQASIICFLKNVYL